MSGDRFSPSVKRWLTPQVRFASTGFACLLALYITNYFVTPAIVGEKLETHFRPHRTSKFDSTVWKEARLGTSSKSATVPYGKRYEMVDDLLATQLIVGANEERLRELLGAPESTNSEQTGSTEGVHAGGTRSLYYFLAAQRQYPARSLLFPGLFANLDRWMLEVVLSNGKVISARIYFT